MPLFLLFVTVPILEIALFIQVGGWIGLWPTLAVVVATALAGTILVRAQGLQTLRRLQTNLAEGRDPVGPIAHGALILVAGVLLLTPGFFTDAVGLALLVPPVRRRLIAWGAARMTVFVAGELRRAPGQPDGRTGGQPGAQPSRPETVEAEYEVVDERPPPRDPAPRAPEPSRGNRRGTSNWTRPPG